jgi:hypothetical protein
MHLILNDYRKKRPNTRRAHQRAGSEGCMSKNRLRTDIRKRRADFTVLTRPRRRPSLTIQILDADF